MTSAHAISDVIVSLESVREDLYTLADRRRDLVQQLNTTALALTACLIAHQCERERRHHSSLVDAREALRALLLVGLDQQTFRSARHAVAVLDAYLTGAPSTTGTLLRKKHLTLVHST